ncbi:MAG: DUF234 domain-containing protein [Eubacteriales bacterium]
MFLFWYRFVRPNASSIVRGMGTQVYTSQVKPYLNHFMGLVFEEMCIQYLYLPEVFETLPFVLGNVGRWWGKNKQEKRQEEIDIMSVNENQALLCECKWRNEMQDSDVIETLVQRGNLFFYPQKYFYVFSKSGFTEHAKIKAKELDNVVLVSYEEMWKM